MQCRLTEVSSTQREREQRDGGNDIKWVGHALNSYTCCLHFSQINMAPRFTKTLPLSLSLSPPPTPFPLPPSSQILSSLSSSVSILQGPRISFLTLKSFAWAERVLQLIQITQKERALCWAVLLLMDSYNLHFNTVTDDSEVHFIFY